MARKKAELIPLTGIQLPEDRKYTFFQEALRLRPKNLPALNIETGTVAEEFFYRGKVLVHIPGFDFLIEKLHYSGGARITGPVSTDMIVEYTDDIRGNKVCTIRNKTDWKNRFPSTSGSEEEREEISKQLWLLEHVDKHLFGPPRVEPVFVKVLAFCEKHQLFEECSKLMQWLEAYREVHREEYNKKKILHFCGGYGWLFSARRLVPFDENAN